MGKPGNDIKTLAKHVCASKPAKITFPKKRLIRRYPRLGSEKDHRLFAQCMLDADADLLNRAFFLRLKRLITIKKVCEFRNSEKPTVFAVRMSPNVGTYRAMQLLLAKQRLTKNLSQNLVSDRNAQITLWF